MLAFLISRYHHQADCHNVVQDIKGYVHDFCRDQHGSRFIQQKLADAPPEEIMAVFEEVEPHAISLMQDVFGNYVIQKCFEHGSKVSLPLFLMLTRCWQFCKAQCDNSCAVRRCLSPSILLAATAMRPGQSLILHIFGQILGHGKMICV